MKAILPKLSSAFEVAVNLMGTDGLYGLNYKT